MPPGQLKPVVWVGDSLRVLRSFPAGVQDEVGYALFLAQRGGKHIAAEPLKGLGAGILEVVRTTGATRFEPSTLAPGGRPVRVTCVPEEVEARHRDASGRDRPDQVPVEQAIAISEGQE